MASEGTGRTFLKWGCFGCLGCLGVVLVLFLVAVGVGWLSARSAKLEDEVLSRDLPPVATAAPSRADAPAAPSEAPPAAEAAAAGRVVLDLAQAEFDVEPGEPGGKARVEAHYDKQVYELVETLEQPPDGPWIYRVGFERTGVGWALGLRELFGATATKVTVFLPPDVPLDLEIRIRQGGAKIELGGLWLTSVELDTAQGGGDLRVSEPLRAPMQRFDLTARMGGMSVRSLGNASPAEVRVDVSMGGMDLDLRGAWVRDAAIELKSSMGGLDVILPRDVAIRGVPGQGLPESPEPEVRRPTLTFSADDGGRSGGIQFR